MRIKGLERERKQRKRRDAMRVDNAGVRRIQLALIHRAVKHPSPAAAGAQINPLLPQRERVG